MLSLHVQFICCKVVDSHDAIVKMQKKKKKNFKEKNPFKPGILLISISNGARFLLFRYFSPKQYGVVHNFNIDCILSN